MLEVAAQIKVIKYFRYFQVGIQLFGILKVHDIQCPQRSYSLDSYQLK